MALVLDWTAEVKLWFVGCHLECSAKPCGGTVIEITPLPLRDSGAKAGVWALVSWLFGSFTRHIFWLIELSPGLNSGTVCYIKLGLGSRLRVVLWEEILPGYVLLHRTLCSSTYYSGQDGQISKGEQEGRKEDLEACQQFCMENLERATEKKKDKLHYIDMIQQESKTWMDD